MSDAGNVADRREAILAAAAKIFEAHGYSASTVEAVAEQAGIAKGSIYNYFHSKQDLFMQLFTASLAGDEVDVDRLIDQELSAGEKMSRLLDYWYQRLSQYKRIGAVVLEFWATAARQDRQGTLAGLLQETHGKWHKRVASIVAQGVETGEFSSSVDAVMAASLIMAISRGATVDSILGMGPEIDERFVEAMKQSIITALTGNAGRGST